jgi:hypothetical protein
MIQKYSVLQLILSGLGPGGQRFCFKCDGEDEGGGNYGSAQDCDEALHSVGQPRGPGQTEFTP